MIKRKDFLAVSRTKSLCLCSHTVKSFLVFPQITEAIFGQSFRQSIGFL